jgi:hypothetical protein
MLMLQPWMDKMKKSLQSNMDETLSDMDFFDDETSTDVDEGLRTLVDEWDDIGAATHKTICKHGGR